MNFSCLVLCFVYNVPLRALFVLYAISYLFFNLVTIFSVSCDMLEFYIFLLWSVKFLSLFSISVLSIVSSCLQCQLLYHLIPEMHLISKILHNNSMVYGNGI